MCADGKAKACRSRESWKVERAARRVRRSDGEWMGVRAPLSSIRERGSSEEVRFRLRVELGSCLVLVLLLVRVGRRRGRGRGAGRRTRSREAQSEDAGQNERAHQRTGVGRVGQVGVR